MEEACGQKWKQLHTTITCICKKMNFEVWSSRAYSREVRSSLTSLWLISHVIILVCHHWSMFGWGCCLKHLRQWAIPTWEKVCLLILWITSFALWSTILLQINQNLTWLAPIYPSRILTISMPSEGARMMTQMWWSRRVFFLHTNTQKYHLKVSQRVTLNVVIYLNFQFKKLFKLTVRVIPSWYKCLLCDRTLVCGSQLYIEIMRKS